MVQRWETDDVFWGGYTGNWIMQEAILATGTIDVFVADMNCSLPLDPLYSEKYRFRLLPVSDLVAFEGGVDDRLNYVPHRHTNRRRRFWPWGLRTTPPSGGGK